ncbi:signal recognition particle, SRP9/SRP14 subunit [Zopfochytrium polystomum]|nr:signal recognition particle, SRP9/SRP14 subunit [Zopfochytrium polystomum]
MYFDSWDEFAAAVEKMYVAAPVKTRFVVKYRHCDGNFVLRATDGPSTFSFKSDKQQDLKHLNRLTIALMQKMQNRRAKPAPAPPAPGADPAAAAESAKAPAAGAKTTGSSAAPASGKKKGNKKKK